MNITIGNDTFRDVEIPILWGERAVLQDKKSRITIINLSGDKAVIEVLGDKPAPDTKYLPTAEGFIILDNESPMYSYNPEKKLLIDLKSELQECQINPDGIRIGGSFFSGNLISGSAVGIAVTKDGIAIGAPLPKNLAKLVI
jgi:hypothetical protein